MEKPICTICQKPKATLECGICHESICKNCTQFVDHDFFSFAAQTRQDLKASTFCGTCFYNQVQPAIEIHENLMNQARQVAVFYKDQGKETRLMSRAEKPFRVVDCLDKDETILRLAFQAVEKGFNTLIDVDLTFTKVKQGNYQHLIWKGTAVPVDLGSDKLKRK